MFHKGDILLPLTKVGKNDWLNGLYHPAVVWNDHYDGNSDFDGIMLTHSGPKAPFKNILMAPHHFENGHSVVFSNTYFVNQIFLKFQNWNPFELVGRLTPAGLDFIGNNLTNLNRTEFTTYRNLVIK